MGLLSHIHLGCGANLDQLADRCGLQPAGWPCPSTDRTCSAALPLLPASLGRPGWLLAVGRWAQGRQSWSSSRLGLDDRWGERLLCSDAPLSPQEPPSPHLHRRGLWSTPPDLGSLLSGPTMGPGSRALFCSLNKCYHNPRKIFLCLSLGGGGEVRDNRGNISQAWMTVLWSERQVGEDLSWILLPAR